MTTNLTGTSVGGLGTCLVDHDHKVVLDIGVCIPDALRYQNVLITHVHIDHMAGAVQHAATRDLQHLTPSRFICSPEVGEPLTKILNLWGEVQGKFKFEVVILTPGGTPGGTPVKLRPGLTVEAVPTSHVLPSQGYVIFESRTKLKPEFVGLSGKEIADIRKGGKEVQDVVKVPVLAFMGDTMPEALTHPDVLRAKTVITECSFIDDTVTVEQARHFGHTHIRELAPLLPQLACESLILTHFSFRHSKEDVLRAIRAIPDGQFGTIRALLDYSEQNPRME